MRKWFILFFEFFNDRVPRRTIIICGCNQCCKYRFSSRWSVVWQAGSCVVERRTSLSNKQCKTTKIDSFRATHWTQQTFHITGQQRRRGSMPIAHQRRLIVDNEYRTQRQCAVRQTRLVKLFQCLHIHTQKTIIKILNTIIN